MTKVYCMNCVFCETDFFNLKVCNNKKNLVTKSTSYSPYSCLKNINEANKNNNCKLKVEKESIALCDNCKFGPVSSQYDKCSFMSQIDTLQQHANAVSPTPNQLGNCPKFINMGKTARIDNSVYKNRRFDGSELDDYKVEDDTPSFEQKKSIFQRFKEWLR